MSDVTLEQKFVVKTDRATVNVTIKNFDKDKHQDIYARKEAQAIIKMAEQQKVEMVG